MNEELLRAKKPESVRADHADFLRIEKDMNLYGLFSVKSNNRKTFASSGFFEKRIVVRKDDKGKVEALIRSYASLGLPSSADLRKLIALMKIIRDRGERKITNPVKFSCYQLLKTQNADGQPPIKGGSQSQTIYEWLDRMNTTTIKLIGSLTTEEEKYYGEKGGWRLISAYSLVEKEHLKSGRHEDFIEVHFSPSVLANLNSSRTISIPFEGFFNLKKDIAQILVPLMQVWFFASGGQFTKNYEDFCSLLFIKVYKFIKRIREQLAPSLDELIEQGFLKSYDIERNRQKSGFNITLTAGRLYYLALKHHSNSFLLAPAGQTEPDQVSVPRGELSGERVEFYQYLLKLGFYDQPARELIVKFDLEILRARTKWALQELKSAELHKKINNPAGFLKERILSKDSIGGAGASAEAGVLEAKDKPVETVLGASDDLHFRLDSVYEVYRRRRAWEIFAAMSEGERQKAIESKWAQLRREFPKLGSNLSAERLELEKRNYAILEIERASEEILSVEKFLASDSPENLLREYCEEPITFFTDFQ